MIPDPYALSTIFKIADLLKSVARLLSIIESREESMKKLLDSEFNAGVRCLRELELSKNSDEFLLKEAWVRFHSALTIEKLERRAISFIGLSFCQFKLGERQLAVKTLLEFIDTDFEDNFERTKKWVGIVSHVAITRKFTILSSLISNDAKKFSEIIREQMEYLQDIPSENFIRQLKDSATEFINELNEE